MNSSISRRRLIKILSVGAVAVVTAGQARAAESAGAASAAREPEKLKVTDPAAVALDYVENAAQVDLKKDPGYIKGSNCDNCLQLQGQPGNLFRPCSLFPGKMVSVSGWCSGWAAEM